MTRYSTEEIMRSKVLYDDENIKIREKSVTLKKYYFPICTSRRIPMDEIESVEIVDTGYNGRIWGMSLANGDPCWLPCDSKRLGEG